MQCTIPAKCTDINCSDYATAMRRDHAMVCEQSYKAVEEGAISLIERAEAEGAYLETIRSGDGKETRHSGN